MILDTFEGDFLSLKLVKPNTRAPKITNFVIFGNLPQVSSAPMAKIQFSPNWFYNI